MKKIKHILENVAYFFSIKPIKTRQTILPQNPQSWVQIILLLEDSQAEKYGDFTLGFFHCTHCGAYEGFCYKLPPKGEGASPAMQIARGNFLRRHAHGDGRVALFERDVPLKVNFLAKA